MPPGYNWGFCYYGKRQMDIGDNLYNSSLLTCIGVFHSKPIPRAAEYDRSLQSLLFFLTITTIGHPLQSPFLVAVVSGEYLESWGWEVLQAIPGILTRAGLLH